jgi:hypothetical protein
MEGAKREFFADNLITIQAAVIHVRVHGGITPSRRAQLKEAGKCRFV